MAGSKHPFWKGGRVKDTAGYIRILAPEHPKCGKDKYVLEHRLVIERHLGRYLRPDEHVHHKNGIKDDNRLENLELLPAKLHLRMHAGSASHPPEGLERGWEKRRQKYGATGRRVVNRRECPQCHTFFIPRRATTQYCSNHCRARFVARQRLEAGLSVFATHSEIHPSQTPTPSR
jgi:hypothetical protein